MPAAAMITSKPFASAVEANFWTFAGARWADMTWSSWSIPSSVSVWNAGVEHGDVGLGACEDCYARWHMALTWPLSRARERGGANFVGGALANSHLPDSIMGRPLLGAGVLGRCGDIPAVVGAGEVDVLDVPVGLRPGFLEGWGCGDDVSTRPPAVSTWPSSPRAVPAWKTRTSASTELRPAMGMPVW